MEYSKDYYSILEIRESASSEIITAAYKALIRKHHPDVSTEGIAESNERVKRIIEAYEILNNPIKKKSYDEFLESRKKVRSENDSYKNPVSNQPVSKDKPQPHSNDENIKSTSFAFSWIYIFSKSCIIAIQNSTN